MRFTVDPDADAAFLRFEDGTTARTEVLDADMDRAALIFSFDAEGYILSIEFLGMSRCLSTRAIDGLMKPSAS